MQQDQATGNPAPLRLWVFGYGSLCWSPGFKYERTLIGYVKGYSRKFWQGNTTHRGTEDKPGRVATLVEDTESVVWGRAFEVEMDADALSYLDKRECKLGGYKRRQATFFPRESPCKSFTVEVYIALESNRLWLGEASLEEIACQIMSSSGPSGHNVDYLLCLAGFMHQCVPDVKDEHLFKLESLVWSSIGKHNLRPEPLNAEENDAADGEPDNGPGFAARMPENKLRCLNI